MAEETQKEKKVKINKDKRVGRRLEKRKKNNREILYIENISQKFKI